MRKFVVIAGNNQALVKKALLKRGNWEDVTEEKTDGDFDNVHFIWKPTNLPVRAYAKMDTNPPTGDCLQLFNHFEHNNGICTKTGLIRSLRTYYYSTEQALNHRYTLFESTPTTFLITAADENQEYISFIARFRDITKRQFSKEHIPEKHCQENLWLIKPANQNQGRGIEIFNNLKDIQNFISSQTPNSYWVAQKYIEKPLLFYGRKFDIRVWVLVTAKLEIFFYKTSYMRTSSDTYNTSVFDNYVHLTNNCLQKHGDNFGKFEDGNTLPLAALQQYFDEFFPQHNLNVEKQIVPRMKDLIIDTILSVKKSLNPKRRKNCFELFGYDFLIDEDFRTWLLEVNTNPYLGVPNDFIRNLLPEMMDDLLRITVDPHYPPANPEGLNDRENAFELIYCEYHSTHHDGPYSVRSPFSENIYPIPSIAPTLRHVRLGQQQNDKENKNNVITSNLIFRNQSDKEGTESGFSKLRIKPEPVSPNKKIVQGKATTMVVLPDLEAQRAPSPQSGSDKRLSLGQQNQQPAQDKGFNHNSIAETLKKIDNLLETYSVVDFEILMPLVSRVLNSLKNWELQGNNEISSACKAIIKISESRMCGALADVSSVTQMINLLDSQDVPLKIQVTLIKGFLNICKKISEKKKIICDKMIHALIRITFACCDPVQFKNYDPQIIKLAVKCLGVLAGKYDKKMYVPGETLVQNKVRDFLMNQGGILALMMVSKLSLDEEIRQMPSTNCFYYLTVSDWELQKSILEAVKDEKGIAADKSPTEENDPKIKANLSFLFSTASPAGVKLESKKLADSTYYLGPTINPNIPRYLLERSDYSVDDMIMDVDERITTLKEEKKKQEQEEEERKGKTLQEQIKEQQQKELIMQERKKKAEELFLKRLEERKKQQEEITKRIEEETKTRKQLEEDQKKAKMQELVKKREEYEKKAKKIEDKKKKMEDEMKRLMEEETEKKKMQRKVLEESFWMRVKAKQKERPQDKDNHQRKDELAQNSIDRAPSVEPNRSQEETPIEKSKLMRTHFGSPNNSTAEARSNTFSNFFKEDLLMKTMSSPANSQVLDGKGVRQRSVEEGRTRKKERENMVLPYIDIHNNHKPLKSKISFEKGQKSLKQSDLFTLNEAEEEATGFGDDRTNPLFKQLFKQPNTVRHDEGEKLKKMTASSENIRPKNLVYLKEIVADKVKEQEKEKAREIKEMVAKHKEASFAGLRHVSPQNLNEFAHTSVYKAYIGAKRKMKTTQQTFSKS